MGDTYVVTSAMMTCSFGMAPSSFVANPARLILLSGKTKGNIMDFQPISNIPPFSMCVTLSNPTVAAATAAAQGVLTPMPCIPVIVSPWAPGNPKVLVQGQPALMKSCQCMCAWGGVIKFTTDGQTPEPPLINMPPMPPVKVPIPEQLSEEELSELSEEDREEYKKEFAEAAKAGGNDKEMAQATKDSTDYYEKQGRPEEAAKAVKASEFYQERANAKEAAAKEAVNQKYADKAANNK